MKYLALISFLLAGAVSFAQDATLDETALRSASEIDQEIMQNYGENADEQGLMEAQAVPTHWHGGGWRGGWGRPRVWPVPVPVPVPAPYPPVRSSVICYARDNMGRTYTGIGWFASSAQQAALNQCYAYSGYCVASGCNYY